MKNAAELRPTYVTNYMGSKQKMLDWIWNHTPSGVKSVIDAFSGSAVVAYMYKRRGLRVLTNDRNMYCYHAARAIVENSDTRISDNDMDALIAHNKNAGTFVRDTFEGLFFADGVHGIIDNIRANCDQFKGYKRDIALFALGMTCIAGKKGFGEFTATTTLGKTGDSPDRFIERFKSNIARINALVFDNGQPCMAYNEDVNALLPRVNADLAYFDPPYVSKFGAPNYDRKYHFINGLMTYWDGLMINEKSKVRFFETNRDRITKTNVMRFFDTFLGNARHIPHWIISYRDHAYPNEIEMKSIIASHGRESNMQSMPHRYKIAPKRSDGVYANELLYICREMRGKRPNLANSRAGKIASTRSIMEYGP